MSQSPNNNDDKPAPPKASTVLLLLSTIGDTTWRMFIPTIGLTILGLLVDKQLGTTPWFLIIGIILGTIVAGTLIRAQLQKVRK